MSAMLLQRAFVRRLAWISLAAGVAGVGVSCKEVTAPLAPEVPTGIALTLLSPTSVRVTWNANSDATSVRSYNVFRNGAKVGEVTLPAFVDTGLSELTSYKYAVSANGTGGLVSAVSADTPGASITLPDATPPTVTSTTPSAGATSVDRAGKISATFSEPLDPATAIAANFLVKVTGGSDVAGTVTYVAATRTIEFSPAAAFPNASAISVTITTGVHDAAGNPLASAFAFAFTTRDDVPPSVISTTIPTTGDVPITQVISVTMSEAIDPSSLTATNVRLTLAGSGAIVPGNISYDAASRAVTFTPTGGLSSATDYVFTVGAGIKDLAGNASTGSFSRSFRTADVTPPSIVSVSPVDLASGVAVNAAISVVFNKAMDASTITASSLTLRVTSSGASVAGSVTYDATSRTATFVPSSALLAGTGYTFAVSNSVRGANGVALSQAFASSFTTAAAIPPADTTPPSVVSSVPSPGAQSVVVTTAVRITFSEALNPSTVSASTILLTGPGGSVAGTVTYDNSTFSAIFVPAAALANGTSYTLIATTGVKDVADNSLAAQFAAAFTTVAVAPPSDTTPPTVLSSVPSNGSTNVAVTNPIRVTFSEDVIASTVNTSTFTLSVGGTAIPGSVAYDASTRTATFTPQAGILAESKTYTATVTTGVKDLAGNSLASNFVFSFTTAGSTATAPTVVSRSPSPGATGVATTTAVRIGFSSAMDASTINGSTIQLSLGGSPITATVAYDAGTRVATLTPSAALANNQTYTVSVSTGVRDASGTPLSSADTFSFTTAGGATSADVSGLSRPGDGWWQTTTAGAVGIHFHVVFDQSGSSLSLSAQCPSDLNDRCITLPQNQAGADAVGPNSPSYVWVLLSSVSGTVTGTQIAFTMTNANGKSFTFTGVVNSQYLMTGTISGATLPAEQVTFTRPAP